MTTLSLTPARTHHAHRAVRLPRVRPARFERNEIVLAVVTGGIGLIAVTLAAVGAFMLMS